MYIAVFIIMFFFTSGYQMTSEKAHEDLENSDFYLRADTDKSYAKDFEGFADGDYKPNSMD